MSAQDAPATIARNDDYYCPALGLFGCSVLLELIAVAAVRVAAVRVNLELEPGDDVEHLGDHRKGGDEDRQHQLPEDHLVGLEPRLQPFDPAELALQVGFDLSMGMKTNSIRQHSSAAIADRLCGTPLQHRWVRHQLSQAGGSCNGGQGLDDAPRGRPVYSGARGPAALLAGLQAEEDPG